MRSLLENLKGKRVWLAEILTGTVLFALFTVLMFNKFAQQRAALTDGSNWDIWVFYFGAVIGIIPVFYLLFQTVLVCFYRPMTSWKEGMPLPDCTVIVPAYNEGEHVADTLRSLLNSDYPREKLEIIAINDGSKDDTWNWIKLVASESDGLIKAINLPQNGGKKHALYTGFHEAKHELVLTIDSDSIVKADAIRNLVMPFADPKIGGAAGVVRVRNMNQGIIPRMLDICFVFSCDFLRNAQSAIGAVLCSPGAISAYRKAALLPHLDSWLNQTFMGKPANIGEDRALTSILLRNDYRVVLQNNAMAETNVPVDYPQLCRTLIRWTRGDVREGLLMVRHFATRFGKADLRLIALQICLVCQLFCLTLPVALIPCTLYVLLFHTANILIVLYYTVGMTMMWTIIPAAVYSQRESLRAALWAFFYAFFNLFALSWICIYSWITMGNSGWLTRELPKSSADKEKLATASHGHIS